MGCTASAMKYRNVWREAVNYGRIVSGRADFLDLGRTAMMANIFTTLKLRGDVRFLQSLSGEFTHLTRRQVLTLNIISIEIKLSVLMQRQ